MMAYGEDGKNIEDVPTQRRPSPREGAQEKEVDRFDEGTIALLPRPRLLHTKCLIPAL